MPLTCHWRAALPLTSNSPDLDNLPLRSISLDSDNLPLTWTAAMTWAVALPLTSSPYFDNLPLTSTHDLDSSLDSSLDSLLLTSSHGLDSSLESSLSK